MCSVCAGPLYMCFNVAIWLLWGWDFEGDTSVDSTSTCNFHRRDLFGVIVKSENNLFSSKYGVWVAWILLRPTPFFHLISSKSFSLAQCMTGSDFHTGHISNRQLDYFLCKHCVYCCLEKRVYCLLKLRLFVELVSPTPGGAPVWGSHTH